MMNFLEGNSKTMIELTGKLTDFSTEIRRVIRLVKRIPDQTKFAGLSLAIEAARTENKEKFFLLLQMKVRKKSDQATYLTEG